MKDISILFPYKSDNGGQRDRIFNWVKKFYAEFMPDAELCIGEGVCHSNLFSRSNGINNAAKIATRDFFVIADTDIIYDPQIILKSVELIKNGQAWVIPYHRIHYLSKTCTEEFLTSNPEWPLKIQVEAYTPNKKKKGGLNVIPRKNFEEVGGFDDRFCGWGGEDDAFVCAMNTLCGHYERVDADIYHLWHSHNGLSGSGNPNYHENKVLYSRYRSARKSKDIMRKLIDERKSNL